MNCSDLFLTLLLILSLCINCVSVAAVIWLFTTVPGLWTTWILGFYSLFFSFVQLFIEIMYPEKFMQYFLYLARFWGRALLYILSGVVLVVLGGNNLNGGPTLMCFIAGVITFAIGCVYLLIAIISCGKWHPVSLCRRCGRENYSID